MRIVAEAVARDDPAAGFALLQEAPWSRPIHFLSSVRGYLAGASHGAGWTATHRQLSELVTQRGKQRSGTDRDGKIVRSEQIQLDRVLAEEWGRSDLSAAIDWYSAELSAPSEIEQRTLTILRSIPVEERNEVARWFERRGADEESQSQLVVRYARTLAAQTPDLLVERLLGILPKEEDRAAIVSAFAKPRVKDGQSFLRHAPDDLRRLVEVARLAPSDHDQWLELVENTTWPH